MFLFKNMVIHLSIHNDILKCPIPNDNNCKKELWLEVKKRSDNAFNIKNYLDAELLYTRCLDIYNNDEKIYSNRSITRIYLNKYKEALEDANKIIKINPKWEKGYFRKAQCYMNMRKYKEAIIYFKKSKELNTLDKFNKLIKTNIENCLKLNESNIKKNTKLDITNNLQNNKLDITNNLQNNKLDITNNLQNNKLDITNNLQNNKLDITNNLQIEKKLNNKLKGYYIKEDGTKTTYFNNDLSYRDKELIGDIYPKKIDKNEINKVNKNNIGSAWSNGLTYEEKDMKNWFKSSLIEYINKMKNINLKCNNIDIEGVCLITITRGKKNYIYDLQCIFKMTLINNLINYNLKIIYILNNDDLTNEYYYDPIIKWDKDKDKDKELNQVINYIKDKQYLNEINNIVNNNIKDFYKK